MTISEADKAILLRIQGSIKKILEQELASGNSIVEVSESWPMKIANVWLAKRFHTDYKSEFPSLKYTYLGDPKNWIEEYVDEDLNIMLAVRVPSEY